MTLKELQKVREALIDLYDFMLENTDLDESGIRQENATSYYEALKILQQEQYKLFLRNAKARLRRKTKKHDTTY